MNIEQYIESVMNYGEGNHIQFISKHPTKGYRGLISTDLDKLAKWAQTQNKQGCDLYYTLCAYSALVKTPRSTDKHPHKWKVRRNEHTIVPRDFIFLDFDFKDQVLDHWQTDPHAIADSIIAELGEPSAQIHTGGGVHMYYHLKSPEVVISAQLELRGLFNPQQTEFPIIDDRAGRALHDLARLPLLRNNKRGANVELIQLTDKTVYKRRAQLTDKVKFVKGSIGPSPIKSAMPGFTGKRPPVFKLKRYATPVKRIGEVMVTLKEVKDACPAFANFIQDARNDFTREGNVVGTHDDLLTACSIVKFSVTKSGVQDVNTDEQLSRAKTLCMRHPDAQEIYIEQQYHSVNYRRGCDTWSADYSANCTNCAYNAEMTRKNTKRMATPYGAAVALKNATVVVATNQAMSRKLSKVVSTPDQLKFIAVPALFIVDDNNGLFFNDGGKRSGQITNQAFRVGKVAHPNMITIYLGPSYDIAIPLHITARPINMLENLQEHGISVVPTPDHKETLQAQHQLITFVKASHAACHIIPKDDQGYGWRRNGREFLLNDRTYVLENNRTVEKPPVPSKISHTHCYQLADGCDAVAWWDAANKLFFEIPEMDKRSVAVMASFASPLYSILLRNLESHGHIYVLIGQGNIGKSTALFAAQSVWGLADRPMISPSSTVQAVYARLTANGVIPACYDDILRPLADGSNSKSTPLAHLAHFITEGRARERLQGSNFTLSDDAGFSQIMIATANSSMINRLNQETDEQLALSDRITEVYVHNVSSDIQSSRGVDIHTFTEQHMSVMRKNAGAAGREYIAYIMSRLNHYRNIQEGHNGILLTNGMTNRHERTFWSCILTAQVVLSDMDRLKRRVFDTADVARAVTAYRATVRERIHVNEITPEDVVAAYHQSIYPCVLQARTLSLDSGFSTRNMRVSEERAIWHFADNKYDYFMISKPVLLSYLRSVNCAMSVGALLSQWERSKLTKEARKKLPVPVGPAVQKRVIIYRRRLITNVTS